MSRNTDPSRTVCCEHCRYPPRWCICAGLRQVECPMAVDVLMHHREARRPTSTGNLVHRVMAGSRRVLFVPETPPGREQVARPGRELWILHPRGEAIPATADPARLQLLLLDGNWSEAARIATHVTGWGRLVCLPPAGPSRNELRRQEQPGKYATAEALIQVLEALGQGAAAQAMRRQFELHVYAGLRTRGSRTKAEEFLAATRLEEAFPELLAELHRVRPLT